MSAARRLPVWLAVAAYFGAVLAWLPGDRDVEQSLFQPGSVHDPSSRGLSLAYDYLRHRLGAGRVGTLVESRELRRLDRDAVLFRVRPRPAGSREAPASRAPDPFESEWLHGGGRLVLALHDRYANLAVQPAAGTAAPQKVFPLFPGVARLAPDPPRVLSGPGLAGSHAVFALGDRPLLSRWRVGRGELIALASPELLENGRLGEADHLELLEALAGGRSVVFDEGAHGVGEPAGLAALLVEWGFGPTLLLLALAGGGALWRGRARLGPIPDLVPEARSEAVDLVDSLGALYERSLSRSEALRLYRESLARAVAQRTRLSGRELETRVRALSGSGAPPPARRELRSASFRSQLRAINEGFRRLADARTR